MILPYSGLELPLALAIFDIDGVVRDVAQSYRRAIADTVEHFTSGKFRPGMEDIDQLKTEGIWNNDWKASEELIFRFYERQGESREAFGDRYSDIVDFFQQKYRGDDFSGYIQNEPLLMTPEYLQSLSKGKIAWGFFSGATQGSADFVLRRRLSIQEPVLVAMEDAPGKPNPEGLFLTIHKLGTGHPAESWQNVPVLYVGDTVADIQTALNARQQDSHRHFAGVGIIPPHAKGSVTYADRLSQAGAVKVFDSVTDLTPDAVKDILAKGQS
ncbi:MAG: TIGR01548 family HAD-type hydrolase [Cyanobacteria bacterium P01_F01_bin.42]